MTLVALLSAAAAVLASIHLVLARGFLRLETRQTFEATRRTDQLFRQKAEQLGTTATDWAEWDDTYHFVARPNEAYRRLMLTPASLVENDIELLYYLRADGSILFARRIDLSTSRPRPLLPSLKPHLSRLLARCLGGAHPTGVLQLPEGTLLLAARPTLGDNGQGRPNGMLVMGRFLTPADWTKLVSYPAVAVRAWRRYSPNLPAAPKMLRSRTFPSQPMVQVLDGRRVAGYSVVNDIYGAPALVLRTDLPRTVYQAGRQSLFAFGLVLLGLAVVFGLSMNHALDKLVTSRLSLLGARLREIAGQRDASARLSLPGKDELTGVADDINAVLQALQQSQDALRDSEGQLRTIINAMHTGYLIVEADTRLVAGANAAALRMIGASEEEVIGAVCEWFTDPAAGIDLAPDGSEPPEASEQVLLTAQGDRLPILRTAVAITLGGRPYLLENFVDISERTRAEEAVRHQAYHDSLTGLPNRAHFYERLEKALQESLRSGSMLAVLLLDLDRFKTINDTLGHLVGDVLLREAAVRLQHCLRSDDIIARLGGDEFAVLLPGLDRPELAAVVAQRLLEALRAPFPINGYELHTSTSIGISLFPKDGADANSLLQDADIALYHAKDQGRSTFRYYDTWINATARQRLSLENDLRHALAREELLLHYQPQVHVPSGRIVGLEALLRWQHPEFGLLLPGRFIGLAEEIGLIESIGEWVVREACAQLREWQEEGLPTVKVAVNLSPLQFHQRNLAGVMREVLTTAGLDPRLLELELTENTAMRNVDFSAKLMADLKAMGLGLCLDDFGVGYTSLVYLKRFPLDTVKIDRSFLGSLDRTPGDAAIVSAILGIARSLGLGVIGEGVETDAQCRFLLSQGCEIMQGFLFSRPVPAPVMAELLRDHLPAPVLLGQD